MNHAPGHTFAHTYGHDHVTMPQPKRFDWRYVLTFHNEEGNDALCDPDAKAQFGFRALLRRLHRAGPADQGFVQLRLAALADTPLFRRCASGLHTKILESSNSSDVHVLLRAP